MFCGACIMTYGMNQLQMNVQGYFCRLTTIMWPWPNVISKMAPHCQTNWISVFVNSMWLKMGNVEMSLLIFIFYFAFGDALNGEVITFCSYSVLICVCMYSVNGSRRWMTQSIIRTVRKRRRFCTSSHIFFLLITLSLLLFLHWWPIWYQCGKLLEQCLGHKCMLGAPTVINWNVLGLNAAGEL